MDLSENVFLLMINGAVVMLCKPEVDGIAGATADPLCEGAMLKNDSS